MRKLMLMVSLALFCGCSSVPHESPATMNALSSARVCAIVDNLKCRPAPYFCSPGYKNFPSLEAALQSHGRDISYGDCLSALTFAPTPIDWKYRLLPGSNIELPLPPDAEVLANYLNSTKGFGDDREPFFSWGIKKVDWIKSTQEFLNSQCTGVFIDDFTGETGDFQGSRLIPSRFVGRTSKTDSFEIVRFQPKCENMNKFLLRKNNTLYIFTSSGENSGISEDRFERSLLNLRIVQSQG